MTLRFACGGDHAGVVLKDELIAFLRERGCSIDDVGTIGTEYVDYPDFAHDVAVRVASGHVDRGLLVCGTGVGMTIAANRHRGVRAVNCSDVFTARMSRAHNDSNILCLGARVVGDGLAKEILATWLGEEFSGGRHAARVAKIELK